MLFYVNLRDFLCVTSASTYP